jgi:chemotaxis protein MotA
MRRISWVYGIGITVLASVLVMVLGLAGSWFTVIAGFMLVVGGTLLAAMAGHSVELVWRVLVKLPRFYRSVDLVASRRIILNTFLEVAEWARRGNMRSADGAAKRIDDPFLQRGVQMVIDRTPSRELMRTLQWRIGSEQEFDQQEIRVTRAMAAYAPALGMLGTLLGLVQMLFGLGDKALGEVGVAMGFAMLTTVYGLVAANLILKPLVGKMEQRSRDRIAWMYAELEAVIMLQEKSHPIHIREALETYIEGHQEPVSAPPVAGLRLMKARTRVA